MPRAPKSVRSRKLESNPKPAPSAADARTVHSWSLRRRLLVSLLVTLHLLAVFTAPFTFAASGPESASPFAIGLMNVVRPYIDMMYLNHGYFFFAPEPGPSHLLKCRLEFDDGREDLELTFPDRNQQWPRLLYHRHFMLAEQLQSSFVPANPPEDAPREIREAWRRDREFYETRKRSFEEHLLHRHGAARVTLVRVQHRPPPHAAVLRGMPLTDPALYRELPEEVEDEWGEMEGDVRGDMRGEIEVGVDENLSPDRGPDRGQNQGESVR